MIWLVGRSGMLGTDLGRVLTRSGLEWVGTDRDVDFTEPEALEDFSRGLAARGKFIDWVVNCAAYTAVDRAEDEPELCRRLNVEGPSNLAKWASAHGAALIHISTDYVFPGTGSVPYREQDPVGPQGVYGVTKQQGEEAVRAHCARHLILRTAWLYGASGPNFISTMVRLMKERDTLGVVADQWGAPTWTVDLSQVVVAMVRRGECPWGTYHTSGEGRCTWHQFALAILEESRYAGVLDPAKPVVVNELTSEQYPGKAKRPAWSVLSKEKLKANFGLSFPHWKDSLKTFISQEFRVHNPKNILVTGGAGFIGSNFIRYLFTKAGFGGSVINFDKLTYAGNLLSLSDIAASQSARYVFVRGDIAEAADVEAALAKFNVDTIVHFAAESHVDRSIHGPGEFIRTNILGTYTLLQAARSFWGDRKDVRFHHVSTDEVYGSLGDTGKFLETTAYDPRSPYSASKASSDHLVNAWYHTYGLPITMSNCSNNYGPYHFPEKLIPLMIGNLLGGKALPVYGDGKNVRDWLYVEDHASALWAIVTRGRLGETYNVGGENEWTNIDLVKFLCTRLAEVQGKDPQDYLKLITYVKDRPGHDHRYAIDCEKLKGELGWNQSVTFEQGLDATIRWYLENQTWVGQVTSGEYLNWVEKNYQVRGI